MMLATERVWITPLSDAYAGEFARFLDEGLNFKFTFTGSIPMREIDVTKEWQRERDKGSVQWGVFTNEDRLGFIGTTGLYSHRDIYRSWEFRILLGHPQALGRGYGTQVTKFVVDWGFKRLNAHRVWLGVNEDNIGAVKCYESVGFKREGILRDEIYCGGKYVNAIRMSILEGEWK